MFQVMLLTLGAVGFLLVTGTLSTLAAAVRAERARHDFRVEAARRRGHYTEPPSPSSDADPASGAGG